MSTSIKYNGKEVQNPLARRVIMVVLLLALLSLGVVFFFVGFALPVIFLIFLALFVLSIPLHFILRVLGRRGFYANNSNGGFSWIIGTNSFARR